MDLWLDPQKLMHLSEPSTSLTKGQKNVGYFYCIEFNLIFEFCFVLQLIFFNILPAHKNYRQQYLAKGSNNVELHIRQLLRKIRLVSHRVSCKEVLTEFGTNF